MKTVCFWVLLLLLATGAHPSFASAPAAFDAANTLYGQNKFTEAANAYEQLIAGGVLSPVLYFNLGNAHFKAGQLGRAIAAYRQAEAMTPRDPDLSANLRFAQNKVQGPTIHRAAWQRGLATLSLNEWTWLGVAAVWVTFALLIARQVRPALAPALRNWTWVAGGGAVALGVCLTLAYQQTTARPLAIIITTDATVRTSPLEEAPSAFTAHDGAELLVLDRKNDWVQVSDGAQRLGWVKNTAVASWPR